MYAINIIDARADTFPIGLIQKNGTKPNFLVLKTGLQNELGRFVHAYFSFNKTDTTTDVVMIIRKFWLVDGLEKKDDEYTNNKIADKKIDRKDQNISGVKIKIDFFLRKQKDYYPLYRFDSTISKRLTIDEYGPGFIGLSFAGSLARLIQMDNAGFDLITSRKKFNWGDIRQHDVQQFDIPILKDTMLNQGVYLTFEEFKNNSPSQKNYEVKKDKLNDVLYIKQPDGSEYVKRDIWGYCDGQNLFVKSANNFFLLQRNANAFYIYGSKGFAYNYANNDATMGPPAYPGGPPTYYPGFSYEGDSFKLQLQPFQLDWEDGKLY